MRRARSESRIYESEKPFIVADQDAIDLVNKMYQLAKTNNYEEFSERIIQNISRFPTILNRVLEENMQIHSFTAQNTQYLFEAFKSGTIAEAPITSTTDTGLGIEVNLKLERDKDDFETIALIVTKKNTGHGAGNIILAGISVDQASQELGMWDRADYVNPDQAEEIVTEIITLAKTAQQNEFENRVELRQENLPRIRKYDYLNPRQLTEESRLELYTLLQNQEIVDKITWNADKGGGAEVQIDFKDKSQDELRVIVYDGQIVGYSTQSLIYTNLRQARRLVSNAHRLAQAQNYNSFIQLFKQEIEILPSLIDHKTFNRVRPRNVNETLIQEILIQEIF